MTSTPQPDFKAAFDEARKRNERFPKTALDKIRQRFEKNPSLLIEKSHPSHCRMRVEIGPNLPFDFRQRVRLSRSEIQEMPAFREFSDYLEQVGVGVGIDNMWTRRSPDWNPGTSLVLKFERLEQNGPSTTARADHDDDAPSAGQVVAQTQSSGPEAAPQTARYPAPYDFTAN